MRPQLFRPSRSMSARIFSRVSGELQSLEHRRHAAGLHPLRQQVLQRVGAGGIGVGVAIDVEAARLGGGDHLQRLPRLAPVVGARAFEMHDLDMDAASFRDVDRLLQRLDHLAGLVAQMGEVAGVVALQHMAERRHLVRPGIGAGRREQPRRHAERAGAQALLQQRDHRVELGLGRRAVRHAHHHQAERVVADQHAGVDGGRGKLSRYCGKVSSRNGVHGADGDR